MNIATSFGGITLVFQQYFSRISAVFEKSVVLEKFLKRFNKSTLAIVKKDKIILKLIHGQINNIPTYNAYKCWQIICSDSLLWYNSVWNVAKVVGLTWAP